MFLLIAIILAPEQYEANIATKAGRSEKMSVFFVKKIDKISLNAFPILDDENF